MEVSGAFLCRHACSPLCLSVTCTPGQELLAGQFAEGAKVKISRLVQEGCTVRYWTGSATWTFMAWVDFEAARQSAAWKRSLP